MTKATTKTSELKALLKSEMTCGDCSGLNSDDLVPSEAKRDRQTCGDQGRLATASICSHFRSDLFSLRETMEDHGEAMVQVMKLFGELSDKDLRVFAGAMLRESRTRSFGVKLGSPVFVRFKGRGVRNYVSNFYAARVLDVTDSEVRVISEDGKVTMTYENTGFSGPSIYSREAFKPMMKQMKKDRMLNDPEKDIRSAWLPEEGDKFKPTSALDGFSVPRLADITKGKKKVRRTNTLCDIVQSIENGSSLGSRSDEAGVTRLGSNSYSRSGKRRSGGSVELSDM